MRISSHSFKRKALVTTLTLAMPVGVLAQTSNAELSQQLDALQDQVTDLNSEVQRSAEWKSPNTLVHLAGYADVGFSTTDASGDEGSFGVGSFSPIFHYQYRDIVMLESELEIEIGEDGESEVKLEYLSIDWFMNDNAVLVAGQFLSPIGQFRQNIHPSWINKMADAPPGFGHDGAAPLSDLGLQVRSAFHVGSMKANYAVYVGNGPEIKAEVEDDGAGGVDGIEYDGIKAEAFGADRDGDKVVGGRFGFLPIPALEIGVSLLSGKATVTEYENLDPSLSPPDLETTTFAASDYDVIGIDLSWLNKEFDLRYEYIKSKLDETNIGGFDLEAAEWVTSYVQLAYKVPATKFEAVLRYTDFDSPHASADQEQTSVGLNYLVTNNFIGKFTFNSNNNPNTGFELDDQYLLQLAYGF